MKHLGGSFFGHELLGVESDRRRLQPFAVLSRRNHALGEGGARALAASRAAIDRPPVFADHQRLLGKIENLSFLLADLGIGRKLRLAMRACLGPMLDNQVGLGHLAQRIAVMAFLAPAPLARARAQAAQDARLLLQPVARRRLGAVGAVKPQTATQLRVLGPKRFDLAPERGDQLHDVGRKSHPHP